MPASAGRPASVGNADVRVANLSSNQPPLVSVVIPCFNQARFLTSAILSTRAQTHPRIETIVVDDGSEDHTAELAVRHEATLIRQANQGTAAARNAGLRAANGEFVLFLDADDELLPDAIASGVKVLAAAPGKACVVRGCEAMDEAGRSLSSTAPVISSADLYGEWLGQNFVWTPGAAMFRREALRQIGGFPVDVAPTSDYAVYLALARRGLVIHEPRAVVRYRHHPGSMSADPVLMLEATLEVLRRERPHVPPGYREAFSAGERAWRQYYGEQIVHRIRREWRLGRRHRALAAATFALVRWSARVFGLHARRKAWRLLRGLPPAPLEPDRTSVPPLGAEEPSEKGR